MATLVSDEDSSQRRSVLKEPVMIGDTQYGRTDARPNRPLLAGLLPRALHKVTSPFQPADQCGAAPDVSERAEAGIEAMAFETGAR